MQIRGMTIEFSSMENKLNNLQGKLKDVHDSLNAILFNTQLINEERKTIIEPLKWKSIQEKVLRQNSRATWIACKDVDSKFFHAHLKAIQARNRVSNILTEQNLKITNSEKI